MQVYLAVSPLISWSMFDIHRWVHNVNAKYQAKYEKFFRRWHTWSLYVVGRHLRIGPGEDLSPFIVKILKSRSWWWCHFLCHEFLLFINDVLRRRTIKEETFPIPRTYLFRLITVFSEKSHFKLLTIGDSCKCYDNIVERQGR